MTFLAQHWRYDYDATKLTKLICRNTTMKNMYGHLDVPLFEAVITVSIVYDGIASLSDIIAIRHD